VAEALGLLTRAYNIEPSNPAVLNQLANHYFFKGQYEKAKVLAQRAFRNSASNKIRAESCYHMGRAFHAQCDHASALQWYGQAAKENADYLPPQYGLGQMHLVNHDNSKAIECFEKVLKEAPDNVDALKVIGTLYALTDRRTLAINRLSRVTELAPQDVGAWLELAKLQEGISLPLALKGYEKAAGLLKRAQQRVPLELWNNLGAIRHKLGKLDAAEQAYSYALRVSAANGATSPTDVRNVTTSFNLARLWEARGETEKAEARYKAILAEHPNYVDAYLRLAACEQSKSRLLAAIEWVKFALAVEPLNPDAWCVLGTLHMARKDWHQADSCFKKVLLKCEPRDACKRDAYATLCLANIQMYASKNAPSAARLDKATELYRSVIQHEPNNLYAANGLGIVCVHKGRLLEAREVFTQVREASTECDAALTNLAQLHALQKEATSAVSLYRKAQRRTTNSVAVIELLSLEARAHFDGARMHDAKRALMRALHLAPLDLGNWYNLCAVLHKGARPTKGATEARPLAQVESAQADCALAFRLGGIIVAHASEAEVGHAHSRWLGLRSKCEELLHGPLESEHGKAIARRDADAEVQRAAAERVRVQEAERIAMLRENEEKRLAAEEAERALIRQKKSLLEEKMNIWREEEAREAEAAASEKRKKRRRAGEDGDGIGEEEGAPMEEERDAEVDAGLGSSDGEETGQDAAANAEPTDDAAEARAGFAEPDSEPVPDADDLFGDDADDDADYIAAPIAATGASASEPMADELSGDEAMVADSDLPAISGAQRNKRRKVIVDDEDDE